MSSMARWCARIPWFLCLAATVTQAQPLACDDPHLVESLARPARQGYWSDTHGLAQALLALCPRSPARSHFARLDAMALDELDEPLRAEGILRELRSHGEPDERKIASVLLARHHLRWKDMGAFASALAHVPQDATARVRLYAFRDDIPARAEVLRSVPPELYPDAVDTLVAYDRGRYTKRPWLAGTMSAVIPGAGQAYAGSWQAAGVAFVLNAVLIGATTELALHRRYITASAAGVAASIFYLGNILNAVDLAQRRNEMASEESRLRLERMLIPEAFP